MIKKLFLSLAMVAALSVGALAEDNDRLFQLDIDTTAFTATIGISGAFEVGESSALLGVRTVYLVISGSNGITSVLPVTMGTATFDSLFVDSYGVFGASVAAGGTGFFGNGQGIVNLATSALANAGLVATDTTTLRVMITSTAASVEALWSSARATYTVVEALWVSVRSTYTAIESTGVALSILSQSVSTNNANNDSFYSSSNSLFVSLDGSSPTKKGGLLLQGQLAIGGAGLGSGGGSIFYAGDGVDNYGIRLYTGEPLDTGAGGVSAWNGGNFYINAISNGVDWTAGMTRIYGNSIYMFAPSSFTESAHFSSPTYFNDTVTASALTVNGPVQIEDDTFITSSPFCGVKASTNTYSSLIIITTVGVNTSTFVITADYVDIGGDFYHNISTEVSMAVSGIGGVTDGGGERSAVHYNLFLVSNGSNYGAIASSETIPIMPSGYTKYRKVGIVYNDDSGDIVPIMKRGSYYSFFTPLTLLNAAEPAETWTEISIPEIATGVAKITMHYKTGSASGGADARFYIQAAGPMNPNEGMSAGGAFEGATYGVFFGTVEIPLFGTNAFQYFSFPGTPIANTLFEVYSYTYGE